MTSRVTRTGLALPVLFLVAFGAGPATAQPAATRLEVKLSRHLDDGPPSGFGSLALAGDGKVAV
ncbi:MAG: hypothetical protein K2V38_27145, partial [Gemmataceae bacterium]|nr:hypothetical protein [Gemmataceae bacterium]